MSLRAFLTRLIWLCVLPGFLIAVWLAVTHVQDLRDDSDREGARLARQAAGAVDHFLGARIASLQGLAASPLADDPARWNEWHAQAQAVARSVGGDVFVSRIDGRAQFHTAVPYGQPLPPVPHPDGLSLLDAMAARTVPFVSDAFIGPLAPGPRIAIVVPGLHDGRVTHVVVGVASGSELSARLGDLGLPPRWRLTLTDSRGRTILAAGDAHKPAAAADTVFSAAPTLAPWHAALAMPHAERIRPMMLATVVMTLAIVGATLATLLGGHWASRRLARAVRSLADESVSGPPATDIAEVQAVRRLLDEADDARNHAEQAQRAGERHFRATLEQHAIALQVREAQLRGIFESASDAVLTVDESQTIVMANAAAAQVFRRSVEALVGAPLDGLIPPAARDSHRRDMADFGRDESPARAMARHVRVTGLRADGTEFPIEGAISQAHVDGQRLYTVILRDITERERAEQALRASKATLEAALAGMNDAILITDAEGRLVDFNDAFARFHRFDGKAQCPTTLEALAERVEVLRGDGTPLPMSDWAVACALRGETGSLIDHRLRRRDTGEAWIGSFSYAPMRGADGRIAGCVVTARDITLLRQVQAELETSHAELRRLVAAQDRVQEAERQRIARELHDDLQQTLAAILMESTAMRSTPQAGAVATLDGLVRIDRLAKAAIVSTRRIVDDLRPQMLEELGLVPALEALARRFAARTGIACEVDAAGFEAADGAAAAGIATCLFRVAQEALTNVAKHARARHVHIALRDEPPGHWHLSIQDDGTGLADHERRKQGSYGLLGMRERVHAVGGTIRVQGRAGAGTTVEVDVALDVPAAAEATGA